jgi:DNA-binding NarL/FixJ family response regulator
MPKRNEGNGGRRGDEEVLHGPAQPVAGRAPIRAFVAFRQPAVCEALALALGREEDIALAGSASTTKDASAAITKLAPDVLLIGASLLTQSGAADEIRRALDPGGARVLILATDGGPLSWKTPPIEGAALLAPEMGMGALLDAIRGGGSGATAPSLPHTLSDIVSQIRGQVRSQRDMIRTARDRLDAKKEEASVELKAPLTKRETDIVLLLQMGHDVTAIARRLGLSLNTVRGHVKQILWKTDAHSQLEAVAVCVRAGVLRGQHARK